MVSPVDPLASSRHDRSRDRLLCACFGLSAGDVIDAFDRVGGSYDRLVAETGVGTKCTACLLDLDLLLDGIVRANPPALRNADDIVRSGLLMKPEDQVNCGHYVEDGHISTVLRVANYGFMFEQESPIVEYEYRFLVFAADGNMIHRRAGQLGRNDSLEIEFASIPRIAPRGWFIIDLRPRGRGLAGSIRPQVGIVGSDWSATYHPQWLSFRTRRRAVLASAAMGDIDLFPIVINIENRPIDLTVDLLDPDGAFRQSAEVSVGPRALAEIDCSALFSPPKGNDTFLCTLSASSPINLFIVNKHRDGSWCVDHFPNEK